MINEVWLKMSFLQNEASSSGFPDWKQSVIYVSVVFFTPGVHCNSLQSHQVSPVSGAVHGFEGEGLLLRLKWKHVLTVVLPVARCLPQLAVVYVGGHHLLETPPSVLALPKTSHSLRQRKLQRWWQCPSCLQRYCTLTRINSIRVL